MRDHKLHFALSFLILAVCLALALILGRYQVEPGNLWRTSSFQVSTAGSWIRPCPVPPLSSGPFASPG